MLSNRTKGSILALYQSCWLSQCYIFPENKVRRKCGALLCWVRSIPGFLRAIFHYENDSYHHLNICDFELPLPCHLAFRIRLQQTHTIWGGKQENCQNKSGGLPGNEVLKAECISYVIESSLPTGNWESLSTFWFFSYFCNSKLCWNSNEF